jgi:hypothetical protein
MTQTQAITANTAEVLEGPQYVYEGDQPIFAITKLGVTTITNDASLTMKVYKGSTDVTSTYTTGSMSSSGNVAVTKTFTGLVGGDNLYVTLSGTCDGILLTFAAFWLRIKKKSGK